MIKYFLDNSNQKVVHMTNKTSIIISYSAVAVLLIVATFFDLEINHALYNSQSIFAIIFDYVGEMPIYLGLPFCFGIIFAYYKHKTKPLHIMISFACVIITTASMYIFIDRFFTLPLIALIIITLSLSALTLYLMTKINPKLLERLYKFACFAALVLISSLLLNQVVKFIWGRFRYRDLYKADNFMRFTPWYLPQGINGNESFPSGHTNSATTTLLILTLLKQFNTSKKSQIIAKVLVITFIICTAFSRIIYGAHYLSDVVVGFALCYGVYLVTYYNMYKRPKLKLVVDNQKNTPTQTT